MSLYLHSTLTPAEMLSRDTVLSIGEADALLMDCGGDLELARQCTMFGSAYERHAVFGIASQVAGFARMDTGRAWGKTGDAFKAAFGLELLPSARPRWKWRR